MRIEYVRDGLVEEFHDGIVVKLGEKSIEPYYIRSCAKPLQASLLLDYGVELTDEELAFCSGSHAGEVCHVKIANQLLSKLKLTNNDLKCGIHPPLSRTAQDEMLLKGVSPTEIHNNCSGKHLGFLAICQKNNWDKASYYTKTHPLQLAIKQKLYELCELHSEYPITTDGCGVPIVSMPLENLILGYKNLIKNYPRIVKAILENPYLYGGENRLDTEIIQKTTNIIAKVGAGGLCVVYNLSLNDGFAVKMFDASMPARRFAVVKLINDLGWGKIDIDTSIRTIAGKRVGDVKVVL